MLPAEAAQFQRWRFDRRQNKLEFTTLGGVQPRAQLIANPTRLVIDLPGTTLGRPRINQPVGGNIREIRIGQFNFQTTRIVVELRPGYTFDPDQIKFQPDNASQWEVTLPEPQRIGQGSNPVRPAPTVINPPPTATDNTVSGPTVNNAATQLTSIQATADGFFVRTRGERPRIKAERSRDRRLINIDLSGTAVDPSFTALNLPQGRYGVQRWKVTQLEADIPTVRITMEVSPSVRELCSPIILRRRKSVSVSS